MYHLRQQISTPRPLAADEVARWLSRPRFRPFLIGSRGNETTALALYEWNVHASAAFLEVLSYAEVILRNAIDAQFPPVRHAEPAASSWLTNPEIVNARSRWRTGKEIAAIERARREATRARLVSRLSFGFWRTLFDRHYASLWISSLHRAFPTGTGDRAEVAALLARLSPFRNRIAHHEPIVNAAIESRHEDLLALVGLIDLEAATWLRARSTVAEAIATRPC